MPAPSTMASVRAMDSLSPSRGGTFIWIDRRLKALSRLTSPAGRPELSRNDDPEGLPAAALAWLGRQGTRALAASIFLGLAVPPLAAYVKPHLGEAIVVMLPLAFPARRPGRTARPFHAARPDRRRHRMGDAGRCPLCSARCFGHRRRPEHAGAVLHAGAANVGAGTDVLGGVRRADGARRGAHACQPDRQQRVVADHHRRIQLFFLGTSLFSPIELGIKLFFFFAASGAIAYAIRRIAGRAWIERQNEPIDGLNVIAVFIFAIAAMDGVRATISCWPIRCWSRSSFTALAFALALGLIAITALVFLRAGLDRALAIGLIAGNRNIGVMLAATGTSLPDLAWFYFALAQFPIYLLPAFAAAAGAAAGGQSLTGRCTACLRRCP